MSNTPCPHGLTRPCVRCDPWTPRNATEADLDRWQAFADALPTGPHRVDMGRGVVVVYERDRVLRFVDVYGLAPGHNVVRTF